MSTIPQPPSELGPPSLPPLADSSSSGGSLSPPPPLAVVIATPLKLPRAPPAAHRHPTSSASAVAADSSYMQSVFSALEDAEIARGVPHTVLEMQTAREGGTSTAGTSTAGGPSSTPQFDEARGKQLFAVYRSRLRRTYILPLVTWLPSFALILLYAVKFTDGTRTWVVVSGVVWLCLLLGTWLAYRNKILRLKKIHSLGLLGTLPSDEVNDVVMNGRALRTPPVYDWEEPLPPYMTGDGAGATTAAARRSLSVRSFWTARTAAGSVNGGAAPTPAPAPAVTPTGAPASASGGGGGLRRWWTASSSASTAPSPTSFSPISVTSIANAIPLAPTAASADDELASAAAAAAVDEIRVGELSRAPTASPPPYTRAPPLTCPALSSASSSSSSPPTSPSRTTTTPPPATVQPTQRSINLASPDVAPAATI
ncbi:hypothetical protein HDU87_000093 [Geranomyces variabilis]|uniref:Uncharacterized protein n=1 Tax=Geranomyces variabilis TaxID=109894 RepID=A0AAD5XU31_9FUNG|nr:hypothetical protein HDU87_000093 [Geranomyces variabilis]